MMIVFGIEHQYHKNKIMESAAQQDYNPFAERTTPVAVRTMGIGQKIGRNFDNHPLLYGIGAIVAIIAMIALYNLIKKR